MRRVKKGIHIRAVIILMAVLLPSVGVRANSEEKKVIEIPGAGYIGAREAKVPEEPERPAPGTDSNTQNPLNKGGTAVSKTGDYNNIIIYILGLITGIVLLYGLFQKRRHRKG